MTKLLSYREATLDDIPDLIEIRLSVTENVLSDPGSVTPAVCAEYLGDIGKGWVCEADGRLVGFSIACLRDSSIWALFIRPGYEGQHIGGTLLKYAVDWLFAMAAEKIFLTTGADTRADRFYEGQGWSRGELLPNGEVCFTLPRPQTF